MCDYCDCRSHPEIASLSVDRLLSQLSQLERAIARHDGSAQREAVERVATMLDAHATREEHGVFAQLREADVDDTYLHAFETDHHELHALIATAVADALTALQLAHSLRAHIQREEADLFPASHQLLSPQQWEVISRLDPLTKPGGAP